VGIPVRSGVPAAAGGVGPVDSGGTHGKARRKKKSHSGRWDGSIGWDLHKRIIRPIATIAIRTITHFYAPVRRRIVQPMPNRKADVEAFVAFLSLGIMAGPPA
jgi:hypothetical protein